MENEREHYIEAILNKLPEAEDFIGNCYESCIQKDTPIDKTLTLRSLLDTIQAECKGEIEQMHKAEPEESKKSKFNIEMLGEFSVDGVDLLDDAEIQIVNQSKQF